MNIEWGSPEALKFVTNVGLITSHGPHSDNIMSAEWTHQISYAPGLIAICLTDSRKTLENIKETKVFGVNLASVDQNVLCSIAGGSHGDEVDKISVAKESGFKFYRGSKIPCLMVSGSSLNVECKVVETKVHGDHVMIIGEVLDVKLGEKDSLVYHQRKFWRLGDNIPWPDDKQREKLKGLIDRFRKR